MSLASLEFGCYRKLVASVLDKEFSELSHRKDFENFQILSVGVKIGSIFSAHAACTAAAGAASGGSRKATTFDESRSYIYEQKHSFPTAYPTLLKKTDEELKDSILKDIIDQAKEIKAQYKGKPLSLEYRLALSSILAKTEEEEFIADFQLKNYLLKYGLISETDLIKDVDKVIKASSDFFSDAFLKNPLLLAKMVDAYSKPVCPDSIKEDINRRIQLKLEEIRRLKDPKQACIEKIEGLFDLIFLQHNLDGRDFVKKSPDSSLHTAKITEILIELTYAIDGKIYDRKPIRLDC